MIDKAVITYRLKVYTVVLSSMEPDDRQGVCFHLYWKSKFHLDDADSILQYFPEFFAQKPEGAEANYLWWPAGIDGYNERSADLQNAIDLCKQALKQYIPKRPFA